MSPYDTQPLAPSEAPVDASDLATSLRIVASETYEYVSEMGEHLDDLEVQLFATDCGEREKELAAYKAIAESLAELRRLRILVMAIANDYVPKDDDDGEVTQ